MEAVISTSNIPAPRKAKRIAGQKESVKGVRAYETKDGVRFVAQVRLAGRPAISKSFDTREEALVWKREQEAGSSDARPQPARITLPECFDLYLKDREQNGNPASAAIRMMFTRMAKHPVLATVRVDQIDRSIALAYCVARKNEGKAPATVLGEFVRLNLAIRGCAKAFNWGKFNPLDGVREELMGNKLIAESNKRSRRPSGSEMDRLLAHFKAQDNATVPMADILQVLTLNAFRRSELVALRWSDLRVEDHGIIVRNRKDASAADDTEALVPLIPAALEIVLRQPRAEGVKLGEPTAGITPGSHADLIFPYSADNISDYFTRACKTLGITNLRLHDLRHEAISTIGQLVGSSEAMMISGHKTERHFRRYVNFGAEESRRIAAKLSHVQLKSATPANVMQLKAA